VARVLAWQRAAALHHPLPPRCPCPQRREAEPRHAAAQALRDELHLAYGVLVPAGEAHTGERVCLCSVACAPAALCPCCSSCAASGGMLQFGAPVGCALCRLGCMLRASMTPSAPFPALTADPLSCLRRPLMQPQLTPPPRSRVVQHPTI